MDSNALANELTGGTEERPVWLEGRGGRLFGILHGAASDAAVVFLSAGLQNRAGPHRMYIKAARRFAEVGVKSLRLDLPGVGDSVDRELAKDFDCHEPGSVLRAIDFLIGEHGVKRVVLLGLCSGARAAVKAAARDPRVDALVVWSLPMISGPVDMLVGDGGGAYMGATKARAQLREWAPKLVNPASWYRYLRSGKTLKQGWGMMRRALIGFLPERLRPTSPRERDFLRSIDAYVAARRKLFCIYGEEDRIVRAEFAERFPEVVAGHSATWLHHVVPKGDHTFTSAAASAEVIARTAEWLARTYRA